MKRYSAFLVAGVSLCWIAISSVSGQNGRDQSPKGYKNSIGIQMIRIPAGSFLMGNDKPTDPAVLKQSESLKNGDYDEKPVHKVRISHDFYMSETEITAEQFRRFRFDHQDTGHSSPFVTGVNWYDAVNFCKWLSKKEHKTYRLPTEAEWEYACRAGTDTYFPGGEYPPKDGESNAWGLKDMNTGPAEWVLDWHGLYSPDDQVDPVGPSTGDARVVRGGGIMGPSSHDPVDGSLPYYRRCANRAGVAPEYAGQTNIGFRIVQADMPTTAYTKAEEKFPEEFVKRDTAIAKYGPNPKKPWFRRRVLLPIPPENEPSDAIVAAGLDSSILWHNHSPGLTVCPNGDVLAIYFSSGNHEYMADTIFLITRLRFGSDEWDVPSRFYDFPDVNEQSALLWNDGGTIRFFGGGSGLNNVPFRIQTSTDNGATWTPVEFPLLVGPLGGYWPQPINSAFRTPDGTMYMPTDAVGGESVLWASKNNGTSWFDTGGRTAGRHTTFVLLKDGSILGMGGKNTNIDGYMPKAISSDGGKTWVVSKTQFPALGSNQRPTILRLASGRLFFAGDWQSHKGRQPEGITQHGAYVALSSDDGKTWKVKTLPDTRPHENYTLHHKGPPYGTLGYTVAAQSPDGIIHLISSMTHPALDFEMNEAWILSDSTEQTPVKGGFGKLIHGSEKYPDGKRKATWAGRIDTAGRYMLEGPEIWYFANGAKQYEVNWSNGEKVGLETEWTADGRKVWEWDHHPDGISVWTQYWPNGTKKHESHWRNERCVGGATAWNEAGAMVAHHEFRDGVMIQ